MNVWTQRSLTMLVPLGLSAAVWSWRGEHAEWLVAPYLQDPGRQSMSLIWFSTGTQPQAVYLDGQERTWMSQPEPAPALDYGSWERKQFPQDCPRRTAYRHRVRLDGLEPGKRYAYRVGDRSGEFRTAPHPDQSVRFVAYADSETEPESRGACVDWPSTDPSVKGRKYLVDQTRGYEANLTIMEQRRPDFVVLAGDLVETGGEQRDWDEFWKHNARLASHIPLVAIQGNHEYFAGPQQGRFEPEASERAIGKFLTYFGAGRQHRYFRMDYGPLTLIGLDCCNGQPDSGPADTNHHLTSQGSGAPDFNPGSAQYRWLEEQLKSARQSSKFTFVTFHHCGYTSGPHSLPPGKDKQSGLPTQVLTPLFQEYGVTALINGHDEMMEYSRVGDLHVFDVGIGGDGLRSPEPVLTNPHLVFLAHRDSPERWEGGRLLDGGKHYGHLEVEVRPEGGTWKAVMTPVYVFPVQNEAAQIERFERRVYFQPIEVVRES